MNSVPGSDLFWPSTLLLPTPVKVVAFDMFVWRELANALYGRQRNTDYLRLLHGCRDAVARHAALFPVSQEFLIETNKYDGVEGRKEAAQVVAQVGRLQSLASRLVIRRLELDAALTSQIGPADSELGPYLLVGRTLLHAFDQEMVLLRWNTATGALLNDVVDARTADTICEMERLGGLDALQISLLCSGDIDGAYTAPSRRTLAREMHISQQLDRTGKRTSQRRFRDIFLADEIGNEMNYSDIESAFQSRRLEFMSWLERGDRKLLSKVVEGMPSCAVSLALRTRYHSDSHMKFSQNHLHDIGFLSVAVPYCDAVLTDGAVRKNLQASRVADRMETIFLANAAEAADYISALPSSSPDGAISWRTPGPGSQIIDSHAAESLGSHYYRELWNDLA